MGEFLLLLLMMITKEDNGDEDDGNDVNKTADLDCMCLSDQHL